MAASRSLSWCDKPVSGMARPIPLLPLKHFSELQRSSAGQRQESRTGVAAYRVPEAAESSDFPAVLFAFSTSSPASLRAASGFVESLRSSVAQTVIHNCFPSVPVPTVALRKKCDPGPQLWYFPATLKIRAWLRLGRSMAAAKHNAGIVTFSFIQTPPIFLKCFAVAGPACAEIVLVSTHCGLAGWTGCRHAARHDRPTGHGDCVFGRRARSREFLKAFGWAVRS